MSSRGFSVDVPAAVQAGAALDVSRFTDMTFQIQGAGWSATFQPQGRLRGGAWSNIGPAVTVANVGELTNIQNNIDEFRVDTTVYVSGAPALRLHGDRIDC